MGSIKVNVRDFMKKYATSEYRHGIYIPSDINSQLTRAYITGKDFITLRDTVLEEIEANKRAQDERDELYNLISQYRLTGMELEKVDMQGAIEQYKQCIAVGEKTNMFHAFAHAYERIIVLLHKAKDYESERNYIVAYLKHDLTEAVRTKYQQRLTKLADK